MAPMAVNGDAALGKGADKHGTGLKKSPTLLFDLLVESDKHKQQEKLQKAALSSAELQSGLLQESRLQLSQLPPQAPPTRSAQHLHPDQKQHHQQQKHPHRPSQEDTTLVFRGPGTPDLINQRQAVAAGPAVGDATPSESTAGGDGLSQQASSGLPPLSDAAAAGRVSKEASAAREGALGKEKEGLQSLPQADVNMRERAAANPSGTNEGEGSGNGGAATQAVAAAAPATAGVSAAPPCGDVGDPGPTRNAPTAAAATADVNAAASTTAGAPAPGPPVDLLSVFTPRVILQELLGELFIPPERLVHQGTFGQGAFATVQKCSLDDPHGGPSLLVAVKSLQPQVLTDMEDLRRFLLEANLVRKLRHPNIVSLHGLGAHDLSSLDSVRRSAFVVMEGLEGGDLRMMVLRQMTGHSRCYSRLDALRWCGHIAAACAYLHGTCRPMIIHRDLKLENVMLTGGPVDNRVAKITDFGLHKRARYSRTEDVLIAVTQEWSTRGGTAFHQPAGGSVYTTTGTGAGPSRDASVYGGGAVEPSYYGGNVFTGDSSHYPKLSATANSFANNSHHHHHLHYHQNSNHNRSSSSRYVALAAAGMAAAASATAAGATAGGINVAAAGGAAAVPFPGRSVADVSYRGGCGSGGGAAAACNMQRAGSGGPGDSLRAGSEAAAELGLQPTGTGTATAATGGFGGMGMLMGRERPYLLAYDKRYDVITSANKFGSKNDLTAFHDAAATSTSAAAAASAPAAASMPAVGPSLPCNPENVRQQPPPPQSINPCPSSGVATTPPLQSEASVPLRSSVQQPQQQPPGWIPPNAVPPPSLEESVHRKMLALMALESAATSATTNGSGTANVNGHKGSLTTTDVTNPGSDTLAGGDASVQAESDAATAPFSVTEFVLAATAAAAPADGTETPGGPSALMLMCSMTLALQQQRQAEEQQQQQQQSHQKDRPGGFGNGSGTGSATSPDNTNAATATAPALFTTPTTTTAPPFSAFPAFGGGGSGVGGGYATAGGVGGTARAARMASSVMKTVPENNRMSMDLQGLYSGAGRGGGGMSAGASGTGSGRGDSAGGVGVGKGCQMAGTSEKGSGVSAPPVAAGDAKRTVETGSRKGQAAAAAAAAARMADATRQVGSLIYMAPELVLSGNYNEKVDVFSFAIMAYELFTGKLMAMKIANDFAYQKMQSPSARRGGAGPGGKNAATGPGGALLGGGASSPLPLAGTASAEAEAEAGVMGYVMRRSTAGVREPLPSWWPGELRSLIGRCWAQDPAERPSFSQIHRELRYMEADGVLRDMDARDPLRDTGCGCTVS